MNYEEDNLIEVKLVKHVDIETLAVPKDTTYVDWVEDTFLPAAQYQGDGGLLVDLRTKTDHLMIEPFILKGLKEGLTEEQKLDPLIPDEEKFDITTDYYAFTPQAEKAIMGQITAKIKAQSDELKIIAIDTMSHLVHLETFARGLEALDFWGRLKFLFSGKIDRGEG